MVASVDIIFKSRFLDSKSSDHDVIINNVSGISFFSEDDFVNKIGNHNKITCINQSSSLKLSSKRLNNNRYINSTGVGIVADEIDTFSFVSIPSTGTITIPDSKKSKSVTYEQDLGLLNLPNFLSTLNITFSSDTPKSVTNPTIYLYETSNTGYTPSDIDFYMAEIRHPDTFISPIEGQGDSSWEEILGGSAVSGKVLLDNPGLSGINSGSSSRHDWYISISCIRNNVGNKNLSMKFSVEYL